MKFVLRLLATLTLFLLRDLPLQLLGAIILLPVAYLYDIGKLPYVLRWFDSADPYVGRDTSVITQINQGVPTSPYYRGSVYWSKYIWLAWRNPLNYYGYAVQGIHVATQVTDKMYTKTYQKGYTVTLGSPDIGDGRGSLPGLRYSECRINNRIYYEYYYIRTYNFPYKGLVCFRFRLGHKLDDPSTIKTGDWIQQAFVVSPVHSFEGIK